jgi:site-specific DNA recombinase
MCGNYNRYGTQFCTDHLVREEELKEAILADIRAMAAHLSSETVMEKLEENMEKQRKLQGKQLQSIENQLEKLKKHKKLAHDKHFDGEMSKGEYDEYMLRVNEEIQTLTQQKMQIEEALRKGDDLKMIQEFKETLQTFLAFNDLTPESLHRLIHRIEIKADGSPRIYYRFSNPSASYLLRSINAQHSTCAVCGNISTG